MPQRPWDDIRLTYSKLFRSRRCEVSLKGGDPATPSGTATLLRLHPSHQPCLRRPPPRTVRVTTSGVANSHGVTGGVYKARERIHRSMLTCDY
jgi:hypothetical protein